MDESKLTEKVQELTDLELALLVSQIASQHCIIKADVEFLDPLQQEIQLVGQSENSSLILLIPVDCFKYIWCLSCSHTMLCYYYA